MIHTSPSYTCLLTLQEKPTCLTTIALTSSPCPALATVPMAPWGAIKCYDEAACIRQPSPLTVFDDDQGSDEEDEAMEEQPRITFTAPLKGGIAEPSTQRPEQRAVKFDSTVSVTLIPSHRDYSPAQKRRMWTPREELRINAVKAQMEMFLDEEDEEGESERRHFAPLQRLQQRMSQYKIQFT